MSNRPMFEKDRLITIFSPELGKIRLLAKRANSKSNPFLGRLEVTNNVEFSLFAGKSFNHISQCEIIEDYPEIRTEYNRISLAMFVLDIISKATVFEQPNTDFYPLMLKVLSNINQGQDLNRIKEEFYNNFLSLEGILEHQNSLVNDFKFTQIFENYSGKTISPPIFLL